MPRPSVSASLLTLLCAIPTAAQEPTAPLGEPPVDGLRPTWTAYDPPPVRAPRRFGSGEFLDVTFGIAGASLQGVRVPTAGFLPLTPARTPGLNVAGQFGQFASSSPNNSEDDLTNLFGRAVAGYRFEGPWGEVFAAARGAGTSRQLLLANGDPTAPWYFQQRFPKAGFGTRDDRFKPGDVMAGIPDPFGAAVLDTRTTVAALDLAYGNGFYGLGPLDVRWSAGGRLGSADVGEVNEGRSVASREVTNFLGAGPAGSLGVELRVWQWAEPIDWALALYARADAALLYGRTTQTDREAVSLPYPVAFTMTRTAADRTVPNYGLEVGVALRSMGGRGAFQWGYQFDRWQGVGGVGASDFDLTIHTLFVRLSLNY